jgi:acetyl-CoA acetyltransferase
MRTVTQLPPRNVKGPLTDRVALVTGGTRGIGADISDRLAADVFEVNEAFAAQALAVAREPGLPPERTNPNGSGVSLGHPVAATGAILAVKSLYELRRTGSRYALATMCIGGGQGIAAIFERV